MDLELKRKLQQVSPHLQTPFPLEGDREAEARTRTHKTEKRQSRESERSVAISQGNSDSWSLELGSQKHIISDKRAESDEHPSVPDCISWH